MILGLPKNVKPIGIICNGYTDEKPEKLERIDINSLVPDIYSNQV